MAQELAQRLWAYLFLGLCLGIAKLGLIDGQCNSCSGFNNLACVSTTQFQVCVNGSPVGGVTTCPNGYVCSTTDALICKPSNASGVIVACSDCNSCNSNRTFACTGLQTFAYCLGGSTPSNFNGQCPSNYVCNNDYQFICGDPLLGIVPTCPTADAGNTTTTTTTPATTATTTTATTTTATTVSFTTVSSLSFAVQFCRNLQQSGRFPPGNTTSATCRQYVYCRLFNNAWTGQILTCPGKTFFNSTSNLCQANTTSICN